MKRSKLMDRMGAKASQRERESSGKEYVISASPDVMRRFRRYCKQDGVEEGDGLARLLEESSESRKCRSELIKIREEHLALQMDLKEKMRLFSELDREYASLRSSAVEYFEDNRRMAMKLGLLPLDERQDESKRLRRRYLLVRAGLEEHDGKNEEE